MTNILIIEDDEILYRMYQQFLQNHGYHVSIGKNGIEGLELALKEHPDLILLDIRMPKMDGMTVLKRLRQDDWGKNAKVIILTNLEVTDRILQGVVQDQPTYYLMKSNTNPEALLDHIVEVLEEKKIDIN